MRRRGAGGSECEQGSIAEHAAPSLEPKGGGPAEDASAFGGIVGVTL